MAYCVHCGVKLNMAEKTCPLCGTLIYDPNDDKHAYNNAWPDLIDLFPRKQINWAFLSKTAVIFAMILASSMVLCDLITTGNISWSLFVAAGCSLFDGFVSVLITKKLSLRILLPYLGMDTSIFMIACATQGLRWFMFLAFPFSIISAVYTFLCIWLIQKKKLRMIYRIALCLLMLILSLIVIEILIELYSGLEIHLYWSVYAVIPLFVIAVFLTVAAHNRRLIEYIKKNAFISPQ